MTDQSTENAAPETTQAEESEFQKLIKDSPVNFSGENERETAENIRRAKDGLAALVDRVLGDQRQKHGLDDEGSNRLSIDSATIDEMIADIDKKISKQMDAVLHNPDFQKMESAWRSLRYLVDHTDYEGKFQTATSSARYKIETTILQVSKEELLEDFEFHSRDSEKTGLYKHVYKDAIGQFGGEPYGAIIANYDFGNSTKDIELLKRCAEVGAMSHAPFLAAASPQMFGAKSFDEVAKLQSLEEVFSDRAWTKWRSFRESPNARYVGLVLPRFMLRSPYSSDTTNIKSFDYTEEAGEASENYSWGNAAFAFATRMTESFANAGWCADVIGPKSGGAVEDLPIHIYEKNGQELVKIPSEILIPDRREKELEEQGFISLVMRKNSDNAAFFSAFSTQKPEFFQNTPEGLQAQQNYRLGTQLPYIFLITRISHYLKVMQRENIGSWTDRAALEEELQKWLTGLCFDQPVINPERVSKYPLRKAKVEVSDVPGETGWYEVALSVVPHMKFQGGSFTLSLRGRLSKED